MARGNSPLDPKFLTPMAAQPVQSLPDGREWLYELKLDGYRALIIKDGERVKILSRNQKDLTGQYPSLASGARFLKAKAAVVDGEIVAVDTSGRPSFQALQHRGVHPQHQIVFYAFDLLQVNGRDLTGEPLAKRRRALEKIVPADGSIRLLKDLPGTAAEVVRAVRAWAWRASSPSAGLPSTGRGAIG